LVYVNGMRRLARQPEQHGDDEEGGGGHAEADAAQGAVWQFAQLAHGAAPDGRCDANQRAFAEEHQRERQPPGGRGRASVGGGMVVAKFTLWRNALLEATGATNLLTLAQQKLHAVMNAGFGRTLGQMVRLAAILYGLYLIGEDFYVWLQGGDSLLGDLIGQSSEWADEIETVKNIFGFIKELLFGAGMTFKEWAVKGFAILAVLMALAKIIGVVFAVLRGIRMMVAVINALMIANPIVAILMIIIGLLLLIWYYWDDIKASGAAAWDWIKAKALSAWNSIKAAAAAAWDWVLSRGRAAWEGIKTAVQAVTDFVKTAWDNAIKAVTGWIDNIVQSWNNLKNLVSGGFSFSGFSAPVPAAKGGGRYVQNFQTTVKGAREHIDDDHQNQSAFAASFAKEKHSVRKGHRFCCGAL